jgi:hypothetical protein
MDEFDELAFVIPAFTPETMPLDRLLQYLREIAELFGVAHDMHLVRIERSSTTPVFKMKLAVADAARKHVGLIRQGKGTARQQRAYQQIRQMARRDGDGLVSLNDRHGVILDFPPEPDTAEITDVRQATTFDGVLLRIGGSGENIPILMQGLGGETHAGFTAPRSLAKQMARQIFEPVRVSGIGSWDRSASGTWTLVRMLIQSYEPLEAEELGDVMARLRAAPVVWPPDADEQLRAEREPAL